MRKGLECASYLLRRNGGRIQTGAGKGLVFASPQGVASYLIGTHEPHLQRALVALVRSGNVFYDVGANCGFITVIAARLVGPNGRVIAFEPVAEAASEIRQNIAANHFDNAQVLELALGKQDQVAVFYLSAKSVWGRLESNDLGKPLEYVHEISVPVRRLDSLTEIPKPDVVKVDIEGGEIDMLHGAMQTLSEKKPLLLIELHGTNTQVAEILEQLGYASVILGTGSSDVKSAELFSILLAGPMSERERLYRVAID